MIHYGEIYYGMPKLRTVCGGEDGIFRPQKD